MSRGFIANQSPPSSFIFLSSRRLSISRRGRQEVSRSRARPFIQDKFHVQTRPRRFPHLRDVADSVSRREFRSSRCRRAFGPPEPPVDRPPTDTPARCILVDTASGGSRWAAWSADIEGRGSVRESNYIQLVSRSSLLRERAHLYPALARGRPLRSFLASLAPSPPVPSLLHGIHSLGKSVLGAPLL